MMIRKAHRVMAHDEHHSGRGEIVRDITIGFADGLTVPFALTARLSSYSPVSLLNFGLTLITID